MALFQDHRAWTDLQPHSKLLPPNVMISAEELAVHGEAQATSDLYQLGSELRKVVYYDVANAIRYYMELVLYVHPVGAGDITLYDPTTGIAAENGHFITWAGAITGARAAATNDAVAGVLLSHYYTSTATPSNPTIANNYIVPTLTEGDAIWLVRRGMMSCEADVTLAAGNHLVLDNANDGGNVGLSIAVAASVAGIRENSTEPPGLMVGTARGGATAGNFLLCEILLPSRFSRP